MQPGTRKKRSIFRMSEPYCKLVRLKLTVYRVLLKTQAGAHLSKNTAISDKQAY